MSQPFGPPAAYPPLGPPPKNGAATAALVIGLLALLPALTIVLAFLAVVPGVVAIVLGILGLAKAREHPAGLGKGMAVTGIVCGALTIVALIAEIVLVIWVTDEVDDTLTEVQAAEVDDYALSDRSCRVVGPTAEAGGLLTNTSGVASAFVIRVRFLDRGRPLGQAADQLEVELADGETWEWLATLPLDQATVDTERLDCRVTQVDRATVTRD